MKGIEGGLWHEMRELRAFLAEELAKLDGKCLDNAADVSAVAEVLACALEARAQKTETRT